VLGPLLSGGRAGGRFVILNLRVFGGGAVTVEIDGSKETTIRFHPR
jgi:hypothetical protein